METTYDLPVVAVRSLTENVFSLVLDAGRLAQAPLPGQFFHVKCGTGLETYLRRPISVCNYDEQTKLLRLVVEIKGRGTKLLSRIQRGDSVNVMGPLGGRGFTVVPNAHVILAGGGLGSCPLLYLARQLKAAGCTVSVYLGFRSRDLVILETEYRATADQVTIATDDGSYGMAGYAAELVRQQLRRLQSASCLPAAVYTCGPQIMMDKVTEAAAEAGVPYELSREERMGCGIGACLVCACAIKQGNQEDGPVRYAHVCKDGPVFGTLSLLSPHGTDSVRIEKAAEGKAMGG